MKALEFSQLRLLSPPVMAAELKTHRWHVKIRQSSKSLDTY